MFLVFRAHWFCSFWEKNKHIHCNGTSPTLNLSLISRQAAAARTQVTHSQLRAAEPRCRCVAIVVLHMCNTVAWFSSVCACFQLQKKKKNVGRNRGPPWALLPSLSTVNRSHIMSGCTGQDVILFQCCDSPVIKHIVIFFDLCLTNW